MSIGILWYVLAGFVLGFTVSTLWEWLYYRNQRLRWRMEDAPPLGTPITWREPTTNGAGLKGEAIDRMPWEAPAYRSSGVFLESEKAASTSYASNTFTPNTYTPNVEPFAAESPTLQPTRAATAWQPASVQPTAATPVASDVPFVGARHPPSVPVGPMTYTTFADGVKSVVPVISAPDLEKPRAYDPTELETQNRVPGPVPSTPIQSTVDWVGTAPATPELLVTSVHSPSEPQVDTPSTDETSVPPARVAAARSLGYPDELDKIEGIGAAYKQRLYAAGIYTWQQVANSEADTLRTITKAKLNAKPEEWKRQAQALATRFDRLEATYVGPMPDDLTEVNGIRTSYADALYRAGICTYEQLAAVSIIELNAILPTPATGTQFNFAEWIKKADELAKVKQKNTSVCP